MQAEETRQAIEKLKQQGRTFSNIYSDGVIENAEELFVNESAIILSSPDNGVRRLHYCYTELDGFLELLKSDENRADRNTVIELMTRDKTENQEAFSDAGFRQIASLMRMSVKNCEQVIIDSDIGRYHNDSVGEFPEVGMAGEINEVLWNIFDTRVSHLQSNEEIAESIRQREITVHRNEAGEVDAVLQVKIQPRKFYVNQVYNSADHSVIHAMIQNRLDEYFLQGGKYVYAWIERDNIASLKFHEKYGLKHDGTWNIVYCLES